MALRRFSHERVAWFLEYACADPILANGPASHASRAQAALRILRRHPEIARANIHTAVVCGDLEEVERILKKRPEAASEPGGPQRKRQIKEREKLWTPLLHLCYGRLPLAAAGDNAVAIARALLDQGADPNAYFEVGAHPCRYTALCGVAGNGENDAPPHPQREALARLLLERGAEPYDVQLLYNTHFHGDILWLVKLIFAFSVKAGREADWNDPNWSMLDIGLGSGARYLLEIAVSNNNVPLAEWLLTHGASPNAPANPRRKPSTRSLYEEALVRGFTEMAELLRRFGAAPAIADALVLDGLQAFTAACFRLDRAEVEAQGAKHPEYLQSPVPMFEAAKQDRADVVAFLLDLGVPVEIEDAQKQRPLHEAASHGSLRVAALLVERGAELAPVETNWNATPLDFAIYGQKKHMIEFLCRFIRDMFHLARTGSVERMRELLASEPDLAKVATEHQSPLMWLPDDEERAVEIAKLLLTHGADSSIRNGEGMTAADIAEKRGLYDAAELLRASEC